MAALTTTDKVRAYLGLNTTEADEKLAQLVTSSSAWVESQVGRSIVVPAAAGTEVYDGDGGTVLVLRRWPVASVASVSVNGEAVTARATVTDSGYVLDGSVLRLVGSVFYCGTQNVSVTYTAGYATVPADLEQAVIEHAAMKYRGADRQGMASASGGGESVSYDPNREWASIMGLLDPYREVPIG